MQRREFLAELKKGISGAARDKAGEILADFSEHFDEAMRDGMSEEEICAKLGQPGSIAREIMEEFAAGHGEEHGTESRNPQPGKADYVFDGVDEIFASMGAGDIRFMREDRGNVRVTVAGEGKARHEVRMHGGRLVVRVRQPGFFGFGSHSMFGFLGGGPEIRAEVRVPADFCGPIKAESSAGELAASGLGSDIDFSTTAGAITVNEHGGGAARLYTGAGNVAADFLGKTKIRVQSGAGNMKLTVQEAVDSHISTGAGTVKADIRKTSGNLSLETGAGNIKLTVREVAGNIRLQTGAGEIKAYLPDDADCRVKLNKSFLGHAKSDIRGNPDSPHILKAQSGMGGVRVKKLKDRHAENTEPQEEKLQ